MRHSNGVCEKCGSPFEIGCKHYRKPVKGRGRPSMDIVSIKSCDKVELRKGWSKATNLTPYCKEHGAMLCVSKDLKIWRCDVCGLGVEWEKKKELNKK